MGGTRKRTKRAFPAISYTLKGKTRPEAQTGINDPAEAAEMRLFCLFLRLLFLVFIRHLMYNIRKRYSSLKRRRTRKKF